MSLASSLLASFAGKDSTNFRRARARTQRISHGFYTLVLLARASLPFYSHKGHYQRTTRDATVAALTDAFIDAFRDAIMQILHTLTSHVSTQ